MDTGFVSFGIFLCCVLTAKLGMFQNGYIVHVTYQGEHNHLFVPLPRHWFLGTKCGQPLSFVLKSARNIFAPETQKETCYVRSRVIEEAAFIP